MKTYKPQKRWPQVVAAVAGVILLGAAGWFGWGWYQDYRAEQAAEEAAAEAEAAQEAEPQQSLPERLVERFYEVDLSGAKAIEEPPEITGNSQADTHIRALAEARGYRLQSKTSRELATLGDLQMQPEVRQAWEDMQAAAEEDGASLGLTAAYRDIRTQQILFDGQLRERADEEQDGPFTAGQISAGEADGILEEILAEVAPPGYSKRHSGYAIEISDSLSTTEFSDTEAFSWLSENDYANPRQFGFLPAYPEGAGDVGPDPYLQEFVWVGQEHTDFN